MSLTETKILAFAFAVLALLVLALAIGLNFQRDQLAAIEPRLKVVESNIGGTLAAAHRLNVELDKLQLEWTEYVKRELRRNEDWRKFWDERKQPKNAVGYSTNLDTRLLPSVFTNLIGANFNLTNVWTSWFLSFSNGVDRPVFVERSDGFRITERYSIDYSTNHANAP
jgi:hypothetical protein